VRNLQLFRKQNTNRTKSGIIASRHGKLSRTSLRLGNLKQHEVAIDGTLPVNSPEEQENSRFQMIAKIILLLP